MSFFSLLMSVFHEYTGAQADVNAYWVNIPHCWFGYCAVGVTLDVLII